MDTASHDPIDLTRDLAACMIAYCAANPTSVQRAKDVLQAIAAIAAAATAVPGHDLMMDYFLSAYHQHVTTMRSWRGATRH